MDHSDTVRAYLRAALKRAGVAFKEASYAAGHDHAYISQYVRKQDPKPLYLGEVERQKLVAAYDFLDEDELRPAGTGSETGEIPHHIGGAQSPIPSQTAETPKTILLLRIWDDIPEREHDLALRVLEAFIPRRARRAAGSS